MPAFFLENRESKAIWRCEIQVEDVHPIVEMQDFATRDFQRSILKMEKRSA
jgi:hypothetical protein